MTTYLGKSCSFGLPRVPFVNCRQFMYLVITLLVLRAGCGIWLLQFLIIAYHFTFSKLFTSCLTAVKHHVIRYCEKVYERLSKNLFWSIKNSGEVLNKLKSRGFRAASLSIYDFSTLYTTLPHNLGKEKHKFNWVDFQKVRFTLYYL